MVDFKFTKTQEDALKEKLKNDGKQYGVAYQKAEGYKVAFQRIKHAAEKVAIDFKLENAEFCKSQEKENLFLDQIVKLCSEAGLGQAPKFQVTDQELNNKVRDFLRIVSLTETPDLMKIVENNPRLLINDYLEKPGKEMPGAKILYNHLRDILHSQASPVIKDRIYALLAHYHSHLSGGGPKAAEFFSKITSGENIQKGLKWDPKALARLMLNLDDPKSWEIVAKREETANLKDETMQTILDQLFLGNVLPENKEEVEKIRDAAAKAMGKFQVFEKAMEQTSSEVFDAISSRWTEYHAGLITQWDKKREFEPKTAQINKNYVSKLVASIKDQRELINKLEGLSPEHLVTSLTMFSPESNEAVVLAKVLENKKINASSIDKLAVYINKTFSELSGAEKVSLLDAVSEEYVKEEKTVTANVTEQELSANDKKTQVINSLLLNQMFVLNLIKSNFLAALPMVLAAEGLTNLLETILLEVKSESREDKQLNHNVRLIYSALLMARGESKDKINQEIQGLAQPSDNEKAEFIAMLVQLVERNQMPLFRKIKKTLAHLYLTTENDWFKLYSRISEQRKFEKDDVLGLMNAVKKEPLQAKALAKIALNHELLPADYDNFKDVSILSAVNEVAALNANSIACQQARHLLHYVQSLKPNNLSEILKSEPDFFTKLTSTQFYDVLAVNDRSLLSKDKALIDDVLNSIKEDNKRYPVNSLEDLITNFIKKKFSIDNPSHMSFLNSLLKTFGLKKAEELLKEKYNLEDEVFLYAQLANLPPIVTHEDKDKHKDFAERIIDLIKGKVKNGDAVPATLFENDSLTKLSALDQKGVLELRQLAFEYLAKHDVVRPEHKSYMYLLSFNQIRDLLHTWKESGKLKALVHDVVNDMHEVVKGWQEIKNEGRLVTPEMVKNESAVIKWLTEKFTEESYKNFSLYIADFNVVPDLIKHSSDEGRASLLLPAQQQEELLAVGFRNPDPALARELFSEACQNPAWVSKQSKEFLTNVLTSQESSSFLEMMQLLLMLDKDTLDLNQSIEKRAQLHKIFTSEQAAPAVKANLESFGYYHPSTVDALMRVYSNPELRTNFVNLINSPANRDYEDFLRILANPRLNVLIQGIFSSGKTLDEVKEDVNKMSDELKLSTNEANVIISFYSDPWLIKQANQLLTAPANSLAKLYQKKIFFDKLKIEKLIELFEESEDLYADLNQWLNSIDSDDFDRLMQELELAELPILRKALFVVRKNNDELPDGLQKPLKIEFEKLADYISTSSRSMLEMLASYKENDQANNATRLHELAVFLPIKHVLEDSNEARNLAKILAGYADAVAYAKNPELAHGLYSLMQKILLQKATVKKIVEVGQEVKVEEEDQIKNFLNGLQSENGVIVLKAFVSHCIAQKDNLYLKEALYNLLSYANDNNQPLLIDLLSSIDPSSLVSDHKFHGMLNFLRDQVVENGDSENANLYLRMLRQQFIFELENLANDEVDLSKILNNEYKASVADKIAAKKSFDKAINLKDSIENARKESVKLAHENQVYSDVESKKEEVELAVLKKIDSKIQALDKMLKMDALEEVQRAVFGIKDRYEEITPYETKNDHVLKDKSKKKLLNTVLQGLSESKDNVVTDLLAHEEKYNLRDRKAFLDKEGKQSISIVQGVIKQGEVEPKEGNKIYSAEGSEVVGYVQKRKKLEGYQVQSVFDAEFVCDLFFSSDRRGHDLELMSKLPGKDKNKAVAGRIYLSEDGNYIVRDFKGMVQTGSLKDSGIDLKDLSKNLNDITLKRQILNVTSNAGHTLPEIGEINQARMNGLFSQIMNYGRLDLFVKRLDKTYSEHQDLLVNKFIDYLTQKTPDFLSPQDLERIYKLPSMSYEKLHSVILAYSDSKNIKHKNIQTGLLSLTINGDLLETASDVDLFVKDMCSIVPPIEPIGVVEVFVNKLPNKTAAHIFSLTKAYWKAEKPETAIAFISAALKDKLLVSGILKDLKSKSDFFEILGRMELDTLKKWNSDSKITKEIKSLILLRMLCHKDYLAEDVLSLSILKDIDFSVVPAEFLKQLPERICKLILESLDISGNLASQQVVSVFSGVKDKDDFINSIFANFNSKPKAYASLLASLVEDETLRSKIITRVETFKKEHILAFIGAASQGLQSQELDKLVDKLAHGVDDNLKIKILTQALCANSPLTADHDPAIDKRQLVSSIQKRVWGSKNLGSWLLQGLEGNLPGFNLDNIKLSDSGLEFLLHAIESNKDEFFARMSFYKMIVKQPELLIKCRKIKDFVPELAAKAAGELGHYDFFKENPGKFNEVAVSEFPIFYQAWVATTIPEVKQRQQEDAFHLLAPLSYFSSHDRKGYIDFAVKVAANKTPGDPTKDFATELVTNHLFDDYDRVTELFNYRSDRQQVYARNMAINNYAKLTEKRTDEEWGRYFRDTLGGDLDRIDRVANKLKMLAHPDSALHHHATMASAEVARIYEKQNDEKIVNEFSIFNLFNNKPGPVALALLGVKKTWRWITSAFESENAVAQENIYHYIKPEQSAVQVESPGVKQSSIDHKYKAEVGSYKAVVVATRSDQPEEKKPDAALQNEEKLQAKVFSDFVKFTQSDEFNLIELPSEYDSAENKEASSKIVDDQVNRFIRNYQGQKPADLEKVKANCRAHYDSWREISRDLQLADLSKEIHERAKAMSEIHAEVLQIKSMFNDLAVLVNEQGTMINLCEEFIRIAKIECEEGLQYLEKAEAKQIAELGDSFSDNVKKKLKDLSDWVMFLSSAASLVATPMPVLIPTTLGGAVASMSWISNVRELLSGLVESKLKDAASGNLFQNIADLFASMSDEEEKAWQRSPKVKELLERYKMLADEVKARQIERKEELVEHKPHV